MMHSWCGSGLVMIRRDRREHPVGHMPRQLGDAGYSATSSDYKNGTYSDLDEAIEEQ